MGISRREFLKVASLGALAGWFGLRHTTQAATTRANLILIVLDSWSARHMHRWGYARDTMPNLTRMSANALVYKQHYATGNYTTPGTASLMTGAYPWQHRATHIGGQVLPDFHQNQIFHLLQTAGYHTSAYTPNKFAKFLLDQFANNLDDLIYDDLFNLAAPDQAAALPQRDFTAWQKASDDFKNRYIGPPNGLFSVFFHDLEKSRMLSNIVQDYQDQYPYGFPFSDPLYYDLAATLNWNAAQLNSLPQPYFNYLHLQAPHDPYLPTQAFAGRFSDGYTPIEKPQHFFGQGDDFAVRFPQPEQNHQRQMYDEYLLTIDHHLGAYFDTLQRSGALENTIVILTSDHGELFERGMVGHATPHLFEGVIHIPLYIFVPGVAGAEINTPTSNIDLLPTLAHLTGQNVPASAAGQLLPPFADDDANRALFAMDAKYKSQKTGGWENATLAVIKNDYKLIYYRGYPELEPHFELFNLITDPDELIDLSSQQPEQVTALVEVLNAALIKAGLLPIQ